LDVNFREDTSTICTGNAPVILATIRHFARDLFEREGSAATLPAKRRKAAWDDAYRAKVLFASGL